MVTFFFFLSFSFSPSYHSSRAYSFLLIRKSNGNFLLLSFFLFFLLLIIHHERTLSFSFERAMVTFFFFLSFSFSPSYHSSRAYSFLLIRKSNGNFLLLSFFLFFSFLSFITSVLFPSYHSLAMQVYHFSFLLIIHSLTLVNTISFTRYAREYYTYHSLATLVNTLSFLSFTR